MSKFRILSIDGGGIKGVLPASFLAAIELGTGKSIREHFDLIVGTSTGGIIALGLGVGIPAQEILSFYKTYGEQIFPTRGQLRRIGVWFKHFVKVKHDPEPLRRALTETYGERKLGEAKTRLVIPSISASTGSVYIYKTRHHPRFLFDHHEKIVDVALATSAAPTYFPAHKTPGGVRLLDGGLWANNPLMLGVVEAITILDVPRDNIVALSLGTTTSPKTVGEFVAKKGGKLHWANAATEFFMHGQSVSAQNQATLLIGKENVVRVQQEVQPGVFGLDDFNASKILEGMGKELAREFSPQVSRIFLQDKVIPFVPVAMGDERFNGRMVVSAKEGKT